MTCRSCQVTQTKSVGGPSIFICVEEPYQLIQAGCESQSGWPPPSAPRRAAISVAGACAKRTSPFPTPNRSGSWPPQTWPVMHRIEPVSRLEATEEGRRGEPSGENLSKLAFVLSELVGCAGSNSQSLD